MEEKVEFVSKSNPTKMRSPATVLVGKARDKELTDPGPDLATACTKWEAVRMVSVRVALPVPPLFVALSVTVDVPAEVGVPEINPVPLFTVSPAGNPVAP